MRTDREEEVTAASETVEVIREPSSHAGSIEDNLVQIQRAVLPRQDLADLAIRYRGVRPEATRVRCERLAQAYEIGATRTFTLSNQDTNRLFQVTAELQARTDVVYMWVQTRPRAVRLDKSKLQRAAERFSRQIYPTTRNFFGSEDTPGVDCDPRVHVLHARGIGSTVGGYFSAPDAYPRAVRGDSNEAQLFVMHAEPGYNGADPGSTAYMSTLAHEFQHMISSHQTHSLELWLEEGAAQFAEQLNGYEDGITTPYDFAARPETQLNTWQEDSPGANGAHYGASYLFWAYLHDRFGKETLRAFARYSARSTSGLLEVLSKRGVLNPDTRQPFTFEALFADWVIANYLGRERIEPRGNRYNYASIAPPPVTPYERLNAGDYPFKTRMRLAQFGTLYYELRGDRPVRVEFEGSTVVPILPDQDTNKSTFWWSNRADEVNPRLTREIDLRGVTRATLRYRTWYRLEKDYDYAYVSVSLDGGRTWTTLETPSCTRENPQNANLGCGYNGASGGSRPRWITESVDLSDYAGRQILLRFEMVTDAGVNREGIAIDEIEIPELGWRDDVEQQDGGWRAEGWVRVRNRLPQRWVIQVIETRRDGTRALQRMTLREEKGSLTIDLGGSVRTAVLAISPTTLVTTEPGAFALNITPIGN
ncbi:MAG: immune inhibitor A [Thermoflexales bacterium]|nr:immune inhibitor A [Thermoflexales bacterium]